MYAPSRQTVQWARAPYAAGVTAEPVRASRASGWRKVGVLVAAVGLAALGASLPTHAWPSTVVVLIPTVVLLALAIRRPSAALEATPRIRRGVLVWTILAVLILAWEAYAFVRQPDWSRASYEHPTISTLFDPVLERGPFRIVGWLVWLAVGWRLVTR
jgi:hypothetical protein